MLNSAGFNFAGESQILRFIYHRLELLVQTQQLSFGAESVTAVVGAESITAIVGAHKQSLAQNLL